MGAHAESRRLPFPQKMADEEENLVDYEEEALDEKADAGDAKEIKKYVFCAHSLFSCRGAVGWYDFSAFREALPWDSAGPLGLSALGLSDH